MPLRSQRLLAHHFEGVGQARQGDDGGAVLIVVEDGNVAALLELAFDFKAAGGSDVLQVDAAEGTGQQGYGVDNLVDILAAYAKGNGVHTAEGLEQHAFALHNGHTGLGTDIAQAQHGAAVGDHGHSIPPPGQLVAFVDILLNFQAGLCDTGGIGQGEGLLVTDTGPGGDFQLAFPLIMQTQGFLCVIHGTKLLSELDDPSNKRRTKSAPII